MKHLDIKINVDGDLDLSSGDIMLADGTGQHKLSILMASKGELKNRPDVGVGVTSYLLDSGTAAMLPETRRQCQRVGMKISAVYFQGETLKIEGGYEDSNNR